MTDLLPITLIDPSDDNPRRQPTDLDGLTASIRQDGILEPLAVTRNGDRYRVLSGHRRLAAAKRAGLDTVPAHIVEREGLALLAAMLVANMQREALDPVDEGHAIRALLLVSGDSQRVVADRLGVSQAHVSKRLRLLELPAPVQDAVRRRDIPLEAALYQAADEQPPPEPHQVRRQRPVPAVDAAHVLRRLAARPPEAGLWLSAAECVAITDLIKRAAAALRDEAA